LKEEFGGLFFPAQLQKLQASGNPVHGRPASRDKRSGPTGVELRVFKPIRNSN